MKHLILFGLVLSIISCGSNIDNKNINEESVKNETKKLDSDSYKNYVDKQLGFSVDYPSTWDTTKKDARLVFSAFDIKSDTADKFSEGLNLTIIPTKGATIDEIADENIKMANQYYNNPKIEKAKTTNDNGILFVTLSIVLKNNGLKLVSFSTFFIKNDELFTLTQTTETKNMKTYGPIFQHIINSFNWTKN